jgi:hypothetical protein
MKQWNMKTMKQFLLLATVSLLSTFAIAQQKNEVWISFGPSNPMGTFKSTSFTEESGFAKPGFIFNISAQRNIHKYWGIFTTINFAGYGVDDDQMEAAYQPFFPGEKITLTSGTWGQTTVQVGSVFRYPITENIIAEARANFGLAFVSSPEMAFNFDNQITMDQSSKSTSGFVGGVGGAVKWYVTPKIFVPLQFAWQFTNQSFINVQTTLTDHTTTPASTYPVKLTFDQKMNTFSTLIGIGFAF